jgi:predicted ATPase/DNA-binding XRE family transcriptional regulator
MKAPYVSEQAMVATTAEVSFAALLKGLRVASGLTQEALAERAGLSVRGISALERGINRTPRRDTLDRLADALELSARGRARLLVAAYPKVNPLLVGVPRGFSSSTLPIAPGVLIGRDEEVNAVVALLHRPEVRLITLTGPGGVGKTRLALEVAEELRDAFEDGVELVELAEVLEADLVAATIGQTLGLRETAGRSLEQALVAAIRGKHLLLLLDNFEHLEPAAPIVARLLSTAPRLKVLVTSRSALRLRAEHVFDVPPLALPQVADKRTVEKPETVTRYAAVELFVQRARAAGALLPLTSATAAVVVDICRRLDGLPLAIELAAVRTRALPPGALAEQLDRGLAVLTNGARDLPARQRTMREAIGWSYGLVGPTDRALFRQLAVCVGGCTFEGAEEIVGREPDQPAEALLDAVSTLVDHHLLRMQEAPGMQPRLSMLQVIRDYALEKLVETGEEDEAYARHAGYYVRYAEDVAKRVAGPEHGTALDNFEREVGNFQTALRWARGRGEVVLGLRLAVALVPFWHFRGRFNEGRRWVDDFLLATEAIAEARPVRQWALYGAARLALEQGDHARVRVVALEAEMLARARDDPLGMAQALEMQACAAQLEGDAPGGRFLLEQALTWGRRSGNRVQLLQVLGRLGHAASEAGDLAGAERILEQNLAVCREAGIIHGEARTMASLAQIAAARGEHEKAQIRYCQALTIFSGTRDPLGYTMCFSGLASVACRQGDPEKAARLLAAAVALRTSLGSAPAAAEHQAAEEDVAIARSVLGGEAFQAAWEAGSAFSIDEAVAYALA